MRSWGPFPKVPYNVNGRLHGTDIDVRLGPVFGINANVVKVPIGARLGDIDIRGRNSGTATTRANARIAGTQDVIRIEHIERPYGNFFSYSAEADIFNRWVNGLPNCGDFSCTCRRYRKPNPILTRLSSADYITNMSGFDFR
jgi:hypothetical protein